MNFNSHAAKTEEKAIIELICSYYPDIKLPTDETQYICETTASVVYIWSSVKVNQQLFLL